MVVTIFRSYMKWNSIALSVIQGEFRFRGRGRLLLLWGQEPEWSHKDFQIPICISPEWDCVLGVCGQTQTSGLILQELTWNSGNRTEFFQQTAG
ncbi:hypothetical protein AVEN_96046-1 [Araneus ventricosus]|uniref:Uncharacterized protein n=1 Tax=Araneus ventricosus TaxID=182803 RepID=A0A4Y2B434_ARAVE|nr:hypothetical protein AVEN_96046-1 [Araneus ventricosus]